MSYRTVVVDKVIRKISAREDLYLSVRFRDSAGAYSWATCWDKLVWDVIDQAKDSGQPVTLDIVASEKADANGIPFLNIVGFEHPGQTRLPL
jgi:hypothetical protein